MITTKWNTSKIVLDYPPEEGRLYLKLTAKNTQDAILEVVKNYCPADTKSYEVISGFTYDEDNDLRLFEIICFDDLYGTFPLLAEDREAKIQKFLNDDWETDNHNPYWYSEAEYLPKHKNFENFDPEGWEE